MGAALGGENSGGSGGFRRRNSSLIQDDATAQRITRQHVALQPETASCRGESCHVAPTPPGSTPVMDPLVPGTEGKLHPHKAPLNLSK